MFFIAIPLFIYQVFNSNTFLSVLISLAVLTTFIVKGSPTTGGKLQNVGTVQLSEILIATIKTGLSHLLY